MAKTNKKKVTKKSKEPKVAAAAEEPKPAALSNGVFTPAQLNAVIFVFLGVSRLLEVRAARIQDAKVCVDHLGSDYCQDENVLAAINVKFTSAMNLALLVVLVVLQCWNTEPTLSQLNSLLVVSPLYIGVGILRLSPIIPDAQAWRQTIVALVLGVLTWPNATNIPFWSAVTRQNWRTLPTLALYGIAGIHLAQAVLLGLVVSGESIGEYASMLRVDPVAYSLQPEPMSPILQFMALDDLTIGLVLAFVAYSFTDRPQRVRVFVYIYLMFLTTVPTRLSW